MFTLHVLDRDGNPHRELCRSEFSDVIVDAAMGVARSRADDNGDWVRRFAQDGAHYVICDDGQPWKYVGIGDHTARRWTVSDTKEFS